MADVARPTVRLPLVIASCANEQRITGGNILPQIIGDNRRDIRIATLARWVGSHRTLGGFRWRYAAAAAAASWRGIWLLFHKYSSQLPIPRQMPFAPELLSLLTAARRYLSLLVAIHGSRADREGKRAPGPGCRGPLRPDRANPQRASARIRWRGDAVSRQFAGDM